MILNNEKFIDLSGRLEWQSRQIRESLEGVLQYATKMVVFPDYSVTEQKRLPTGTTTEFKDDFLLEALKFVKGADIGCGMAYTFFEGIQGLDFLSKQSLLDDYYHSLQINQEVDLGGGNHFIDLITSNEEDGNLGIVVHTGPNASTQGKLSELTANPDKYMKEYDKAILEAKVKRYKMIEMFAKIIGEKISTITDLVHNTIKVYPNGSIRIFKGTINLDNLDKEEKLVLPSNMDGEMAFYTPGNKARDALNSISHGTGRKFSRGQAKDMVRTGELKAPGMMRPTNMEIPISEYPGAYNSLNDTLELLINNGLIDKESIKRATPIAYIGHI